MAILTPKQKKLRIFVYVFFVILVITGLVLYFGFLRGSKTSPSVPTLAPSSSQGGLVKRISIDWDFLESEIVEELRFFGEHPVEEGEKGRDNPFLPI